MTEYDLLLAEEELIADAQIFLLNLMAETGFSRAALARELGISKAAVSQIFALEPKNLTLRTLARIAAVMGERVSVSTRKSIDASRRAERACEGWLMPEFVNEAANENFAWDESEFVTPDVKFDLGHRKKYRVAA